MSLSHEGLRSTFDLDAEAEIIKPQDTVVRIGALRLSAAGEYGLDEVTNFATDGFLTISQAAPSDPNNPAGTSISPQILDAEFAGTLTRDLGIAYVGLRGTVGRTNYGETTLANATVVDNSYSNNTRYGGGLRLSHQLTPIVEAFADGSVEYRTYDAASPTLLVKLDSTDYDLRGGLSAEIGTILEAEGSVGVALRRFADASLADVQAMLYEASVTFRPDETLEFIGTLESSIEAPGPNSAGIASIERTVTGEARYKVNTWWSVWAAAGWSQKTAVGATNTETGFNVGGGSEYRLNRHVALTADYTFSQREVTATPRGQHAQGDGRREGLALAALRLALGQFLDLGKERVGDVGPVEREDDVGGQEADLRAAVERAALVFDAGEGLRAHQASAWRR